jgi:hypothetical protein
VTGWDVEAVTGWFAGNVAGWDVEAVTGWFAGNVAGWDIEAVTGWVSWAAASRGEAGAGAGCSREAMRPPSSTRQMLATTIRPSTDRGSR